MVYDSRTHIQGILNAYQNGQIGGNVYFLNPHGIVVGKEGTLNVQQLHLMTPTEKSMENFFTDDGQLNATSINQLMNDEIPLSESGLITVKGKIHGGQKVILKAHNIKVKGRIAAGYSTGLIGLEDVVNTEGLQEASEAVVHDDGSIELMATGDVDIKGELLTEGKDNAQGGDISVKAQGNISLEKGAILSAKGQGENSHGGTILVYGNESARFEKGAMIDVSGGELSGDGGFAEFSAKKTVHLKGGQFRASTQKGKKGFILIDPQDLTISTNQFLNGGDYSLTADNSITISNSVIISTRQLSSGNDHANGTSSGNSGDLTLSAPQITIGDGTQLFGQATNGYTAGNILLEATSDTSATINVGNALIKGGNITMNATADSNRSLQNSNPVSTARAAITLNTGALLEGSGNISLSAIATQGAPTINNGVFDARDSKATMRVYGATLNADGNVALNSSSSMTTDLGAWLADVDELGQLSGLGIPLGFLVGTTDSQAETTLGGATRITAGGTVDVTSSAKTQSTVAAQATSLVGAVTVGISDIKNEAKTSVKGTTHITSGGTVALRAQGMSLVETSADANAVGSSGGSFAITVGHLDADTHARLFEGAKVTSSGGLNIYADTLNQFQSTSRAGLTETDAFIKGELSNSLTNAGTNPLVQSAIQQVFDRVLDKIFEQLAGDDQSSSSVQVAGALSFNIVNSETEASLTGHTNKTLSSSALMDIQSRSVTHAMALASGIAGGGSFGGGAGLAIQVAENTNKAFVRGDSNSLLTLDTEGLSVQSLTESYDSTITDENNNDFSAIAYSGQGESDVGLAGALGINLVNENKGEAFLGEGTSIDLGNKNLTIVASNETSTLSVADGIPEDESEGGGTTAVDALFDLYDTTSESVGSADDDDDDDDDDAADDDDDGLSLGVGASVALDISKTQTFATIAGGALISNVADIEVKAEAVSSHDVAGEAAASGGISIVPLISLIVAEDRTEAKIESSSNALSATGDVNVSAIQEVSLTSQASGDAGDEEEAPDFALGMSVDVNISYSGVEASIDRDVTSSGEITLLASGSRSIASGASASVNGGGVGEEEEEEDEGGEEEEEEEEEEDEAVGVIETIISLVTLGNDLSSSLQKTNGQETAGQASVEGAEEDDGSGGSSSSEEEESSTVSIAASLALNVTNANTKATLGRNRSFNASGVSVLVEDNTDSKVVSNGGTAGSDSNLGAALALNIVDVDLEASVGSGTTVESSKDIEVSVSSLGVDEEDAEGNTLTDETSTFTSTAVAGAGQGNLSLAGAVAINVVDVEAQAKILENANVITTGSGNLTISTSTNTAYETFGEGISGGLTTPTIEDAKDKFSPFDKLKARVDGYTFQCRGSD